MGLRLDRNILQWFDYFFEKEATTFTKQNFVSNLYQESNAGSQNIGVTLEKQDSKYWKLYFEIPSEVAIKLRKNVHPLFNQYIYEGISIYSDVDIYEFINSNLMKVFDSVCSYIYNPMCDLYVADFKDEFIENCGKIDIGDIRIVAKDLYIMPMSNDCVKFFNYDQSFILTLRYNLNMDEDLLDSLLNLRKSIILNK
ncbi:MAG: hypothetical protein LBN09_09530 [Clostridioides sp.]|nr:hypothetical protein [Clostridioides sp.]